jgi:hypothetical protein
MDLTTVSDADLEEMLSEATEAGLAADKRYRVVQQEQYRRKRNATQHTELIRKAITGLVVVKCDIERLLEQESTGLLLQVKMHVNDALGIMQNLEEDAHDRTMGTGAAEV